MEHVATEGGAFPQAGLRRAPEPPRGRLRQLWDAAPHPVISVVAGILLWELAVRLLDPNPLVIVAPTAIVQELVSVMQSGTLWEHLIISLQAFAIGYVGCALLLIPIGLLIGSSDLLHSYASPWISGLYATPIIALAPIVIIAFGFGLASKIGVVALMVAFPVLINAVAGAKTVRGELKEVGVVFNAGPVEQFARVILPGSVAFILTGLRLAIGRGLVGVIVADLFGAKAGLGLLLLESAQRFRTDRLYVVVIILAVLGVALTAIVAKLERHYYART